MRNQPVPLCAPPLKQVAPRPGVQRDGKSRIDGIETPAAAVVAKGLAVLKSLALPQRRLAVLPSSTASTA